MSADLMSHTTIRERLRPFRLRAMQLSATRTVLSVAAVAIISILVSVWIDLIWALPTSVRWMVTRVGLLAAVIAAAILSWIRIRSVTHEQIASAIDSRERTGGEVLAALQLSQQGFHPRNNLALGFAEIATDRASQRVVKAIPKSVLPMDALHFPSQLICGVVLCTLCIAAVMPGIAWTQWQRFLFPASDVPPYTGVVIDLELEKDSVLFGADVMAVASVTSGNVERMNLVARNAQGVDHELPMLPQKTNAGKQF
ncbi:MAG: hypothetical protein ABL921_03500 [Pirellula sp.]